jgi:hypothetical protein
MKVHDPELEEYEDDDDVEHIQLGDNVRGLRIWGDYGVTRRDPWLGFASGWRFRCCCCCPFIMLFEVHSSNAAAAAARILSSCLLPCAGAGHPH